MAVLGNHVRAGQDCRFAKGVHVAESVFWRQLDGPSGRASLAVVDMANLATIRTSVAPSPTRLRMLLGVISAMVR